MLLTQWCDEIVRQVHFRMLQKWSAGRPSCPIKVLIETTLDLDDKADFSIRLVECRGGNSLRLESSQFAPGGVVGPGAFS